MRWATRVINRQALRHRMMLLSAVLYEDMPSLGLGPMQYAVYDAGSERLRMNLVKAVTDTYVSIIARNKPKPQALTDDGDWSLRKKAKGLTRWWEGKSAELDLYRDVSDPACLFSGVFGLGAAKVYREWPQKQELWDVGVEHVYPWELLADDAEWQKPKRARTLCHRKTYDRLVLAEMFPKCREYIIHHAPRMSPMATASDWTIDTTADLVAVFEFWHLPAYPGADDGLHVICVEGETLFEERWDRMRFPFAWCYRTRPTMGLWGTSITHELRGLQVDINTTLLDMQECLRLYGKPRIIAPAGSFEKDAWDDDVDSILEFTGQTPPTLYTPQVMPPEQYVFLQQKWARGFELIGVSQESSQGQVPEGLSGSGASIRAWNDVQDGRLYKPSSNFEDFHMQLADLMIDEGRAIAEVRPDYASTWRGKTYVEVVRFRDVDPGKDKFYLQTYPVSRLSKSPAMRLAQLQELFNSKVIDADAFRALLEFPDLESEDTLATAMRELTDKMIDRFLEADDPDAPGVFLYPEPEFNLAYMKGRMQLALHRAVLDNAPEGNCRLIRNYIGLCDKMQAQAQAALAPPAGAPGAPGGLPAGPPPPNVAQFPPGTLSPMAGPQQPVLGRAAA